MSRNSTITAGQIKAVRKALNRSQEQMAAILMVHKQTWNRWEKGHTAPGPRDAAALLRWYNQYVIAPTQAKEITG